MSKPTKVTSTDFIAPRAVLLCDQGRLELTAYNTSIIHVAYFPCTKPCELRMWGIRAEPEANLQVQTAEDKGKFTLQTDLLTAEVDLATARLTFRAGKQVLLAGGTLGLEAANVSGEDTYHVDLAFDAPADEHYYGLGQHQVGWMDHRGQEVKVWHDYAAAGGEIVGVPFLVSNRGYGLVLDNPSRVTVRPGTDGRTTWHAEAGPAVSFFVLFGPTTDDIYTAYRFLTGPTPLLPKAAYAYIQCKQRYASQDEVLQVGREYRRRGYPCDMLIVDWFHWKVLGDLDLDTQFWPDSAAMNKELTDLGYQVMVSCWPRFMKESRHYAELEKNGYFMKLSDGQTLYGTPEDQRGAVIDTTTEACGRWFWEKIRDSYAAKGYTSWWLDEDEPDICPHPYFLAAGTGAAVHNIYPLTHTQAVYEGHRRDMDMRCLILSRSAYLGAQANGATFWSSDIYPTWDVLARQIPAGLNFCATGFAYWSSDIGGWQDLKDRPDKSPSARKPLIAPRAEDRDLIGDFDDYIELYVRWFQYGAFCPTFRAHGTRKANEVWSYGPEAEAILVKYLRLRYRLLPYIYSLAFKAYETGTPFMRALFMDFPDDKAVADIKDQYMFGPAFLVAPVVEQGRTSRAAYLPAGCNWYDYWTGEKHPGGQTITAEAPIDTLPLFVREGSIIPHGQVVQHTGQPQNEIEVWVYRGADGQFDLYDDDGRTYNYERGRYDLTSLRWDDRAGNLEIEGDRDQLLPRLAKEYLKVIG